MSTTTSPATGRDSTPDAPSVDPILVEIIEGSVKNSSVPLSKLVFSELIHRLCTRKQCCLTRVGSSPLEEVGT